MCLRHVRSYVEVLDDTSALIRFNSVEDCTTAMAVTSVDGHDVNAVVATGDVEQGMRVWVRVVIDC